MKTLIILLLSAFSFCYAQEKSISGFIRDAKSNDPLPYANISVQEANKGISTNDDGKFIIKLLPGKYELLISYIGYKTEIVKIELKEEDIQLNINLISTDLLLQEVSVYAATESSSPAVSSISLQSKEMEEISSVFPDVFRSIQALPGIVVNNEFSAKFNVRGGNYDENLVLVNGAQVYEPFHVKEAENASIGIFNMDLMKKVNLITGGFSAQYGDRLSSVLDIEYREGRKDKYSGSASLSLTNLDGIIEGPLTSNGSFIIGLRKSYLEYVISLIDFGEPVKPSFYDVQGVITYNLSGADKLQLKFIHAGDDFELITGPQINSSFTRRYQSVNGIVNSAVFNQDDEKDQANYYSNLFDLQSSFFITNNFLLKTSLSYYWQRDNENFFYSELYRDDFTIDAFPGLPFFYTSFYKSDYDNILTIKTLEPKISFDIKVHPFYDIKTGFSYTNIKYEQELIDLTTREIKQNYEQYPDTISQIFIEDDNIFPQNIDAGSHKLAGYLENVVQVTENFIFNAGGRIDYFDFNKDLTLSPRLSASYKFPDGINIRAAWGHYYQSPIYRQLAYSTPSDTNTQSQKAEHYILSIEKNFLFEDNNSFNLKVEGYYKKYSDLISTTGFPGGRVYYSRENDSKGNAKGIDLYASLKLDYYYGWISYGYLIAKEDILNDNQGEYPRFSDQRHTLSIVNDFYLGKDWSLNLRLNYGSGFSYTPRTIKFNDEINRFEWVTGGKNSEYLPSYKRVDVRVTKEFELFSLPAKVFLDVSNLFNFKNIYRYRYRYDDNGNPYRTIQELWPVIPSLGLTVQF